MIVLRCVSHPEAQWNNVKEAGFACLNTLLAQVITGMKNQLILTGPKVVSLQNRRIATTVIIGCHAFERDTLTLLQPIDINFDPLTRTSLGGIQYVSREPSHVVILQLTQATSGSLGVSQ